MADSFRICIDVEQLRVNLGAQDKRDWTIQEAKDWLRGELFIERGNGWICEEIQLGLLKPDEILHVEEI